MQSGGEKDNGTKTVTFTQRESQIGEHNANLTQSLAGNAQEQTNAQNIKFRIVMCTGSQVAGESGALDSDLLSA
jgi:hypothetical protein